MKHKIRHFKLKRELGLIETTLYGVGIILGAGIYALIGKSAGFAGNALWMSFIIAAIIASFTGLSYAELSSLYPKEAAEYVYTKRAFKRNYLSLLVAFTMILAGTVAAATVSLGFAGYFSYLFGGPIPVIALSLIFLLSLLNYYGIKESARFNIISTIIEIGGLVFVVLIGLCFIGSVGTGVAPAYVDRIMRRPKAIVKYVPELKKYCEGVNVSKIINDYLDEGESVIIEGAHATGLSNFHGTYPYTNAYDNTASALLSQTGIGPKKVDHIILVFKSFVSRVGKGPLKGELPPEESDKLGWTEYGTVSGRRRRAAPFDVEFAKNSIRLNTPTEIAITKFDILYPEIASVTEYDKLPNECQQWIEDLEKELETPITLIKTGPEIKDIIDLRREKGII